MVWGICVESGKMCTEIRLSHQLEADEEAFCISRGFLLTYSTNVVEGLLDARHLYQCMGYMKNPVLVVLTFYWYEIFSSVLQEGRIYI